MFKNQLALGKNISNYESSDENHVVLELDGLIEKVGYGKYLLSRKYYDFVNKKGEYTRRRGLDKSANKLLILAHLKHHERGYMKDLREALKNDIPKLTINKYLAEFKRDGLIEFVGNPKIARGKNRGYWKLKTVK